MSKTAQRRHQQLRHMVRRLRYPTWAWVQTSPALSDADRAMLRARAARHTVLCSCFFCRDGRLAAAQHKRARAVTVREAVTL